MIDSVTIRFTAAEFKALGGKLDNCIPQKRKLIKGHSDGRICPIKKEMFMPNPKNTHSLNVAIDEFGRIRIKGSIRKWYFGRTSISELTKEQFMQAIKEIAETLHIPCTSFMVHRGLTHIELGYTIITKTPISRIIRRIIQNGRMPMPYDYQNKHETVYSVGSDKRLRIYDKSKEMLANAKRNNERIEIGNAINRLNRKGQYLLRLEVEMLYSESLKRYSSLSIKSIEDLYQNWYRLHALSVKELAKVRILGKIILSDRMTPKERGLARTIIEFGFEKGVEKYAMAKGKDINQIKRESFRLMDRYSSHRTYSIREYRKDIARHIIRVNRYHEKLPLSEMFHLLWRTKKSRKIDFSAL